jgi:hypothetical protein
MYWLRSIKSRFVECDGVLPEEGTNGARRRLSERGVETFRVSADDVPVPEGTCSEKVEVNNVISPLWFKLLY